VHILNEICDMFYRLCTALFCPTSRMTRKKRKRSMSISGERYEQKEEFVISQCKQQISGVLRVIAMLSSREKQKSSKGTFEGLANRVFKKWYKHSTQEPTHGEKFVQKPRHVPYHGSMTFYVFHDLQEHPCGI